MNPSHSELFPPLNKGLLLVDNLGHPTSIPASARFPPRLSDLRLLNRGIALPAKGSCEIKFIRDQRVLNSVVIRAVRQAKYRVGKI